MNDNDRIKYENIIFIFIIFLSLPDFILIKCDSDCPRDKPVYKPSTEECTLEYCTEEQYTINECIIKNTIIKTQFISQFLYQTENNFPIYSSIGTNDEGDLFFESSLGKPYSQKTISTLKNDGREYIDGIKTYRINSGNYFYSTYGQGAIVTINTHKCYLKISPNESIEMFDFDDKKYTFSYIKEIFDGFDIKSHKNALLRTNTVNTFIYAFINSDNYVAMIKFKIVSNNANNSIQIIKTLKEDFKTIPTDTRTCMITKNQYIECLDIDENQMYVIRIYNIDLKFLKQYELEKNNSPLERAIASYHETVWLKDEISIFVYYNDTKENGAKPIIVLKKLTVKSSQVTLSNLNNYLIRDTFFKNMQYQFSDTENSLAIFNAYYFGITSLAYGDNNSQYLIVALANIFNDDKTIDTHYFNIPLTDLYDINCQSGLRAFGYKNAYGVQMNYLHKNIPTSGFIIFGYGNTTDPDPINNLFDKYDSYTIKVKDFYQGIDNNLFCYVFVDIEVTRIPSSTYFSMKTASGKTIKKGSKINLNDEIIITKIKGKTPPVGRYVLGLSPYLNEADYDGFTKCSVDRDMFGEQVPTNWYPDEFYGRTIEFKFTVGIDCFVNCLTCNEKGTNVNDQKCSLCKDGYYFLDNTNNCFGEIPEGYYFNETKKIYMKCFDSCKACSKMKEGNNHNCKVCKDNYIMFQNTNCFNCKLENNYLNYEQTECVDKLPDGYYINDTEYNTIDKCYEKCKTCKEGSLSEKNMKCLSCYNDKGFYLKEGSNNCLSEIKEGEYLDNDNKIIKKCNIACKTCYAKEIINDKGDVINCDSCNTNEGFYLIDGTTICTNKTLEKSTEIISNEQKETIITKKCHKNCLDCSDFSLNDQEMKCLTCDNIKGFYLLEGTTNCIKNPYPGYYLKENELKKCYEKCLTCSEGPIFSEKGLIINMNCDSCNEKQGLQLIQGTKNCEIVINDNYTFIYGCPRDKPILKNKKCVLEYCTEEQYENAECIISNPIIEKQWISEYPSFSNENQPLYSTIGITSDNNNLILVSNIGSPFSVRNIFTLDEMARGYFDGIPDKIIDLKSNLFSCYGNGALFEINGNKVFMKISNYETLEIYDLDEDKYTYTNLQEKLGYKVESSKNSLLKIIGNPLTQKRILSDEEENIFIYAYITVGNHLIMTKFEIISNEAENCIKILKTNLEEFITIPKNSRRCLVTKNQFIECLDMDENQTYVIRIYDSELNFLKQYKLEKNYSPNDRAYYSYHEAIWLKEDISVFVYYVDITENKIKPNILLKKLIKYNNTLQLIDILAIKDNEHLYNNISYSLSDSENSLTRINEEYFALATLTIDEKNHLLLALMKLYNNDTSISIKYYDIPIKDLYDINYYGNLKSFGYKNLFGIQFDHRRDNEYISGFIIFGFGNSLDPEPIHNIFEKSDTYIFNISKYIKVQNNVLCYKLEKIIINNIPEESTGILIKRNNENKTLLKNGDKLDINEEIIINYSKDITDIQNINYKLSFTPYLIEDDSYDCSIYEEKLGNITNQEPNLKEFQGRTIYFYFTVDNCHKNCLKCKEIGKDIFDQKCDECLDDYYFAENSKNCFNLKEPPSAYYFDEKNKIFKKCYEKCKTCKEKGTSEYDMKCSSCENEKGFFIFSGTKNCVKMPIPGYYIDNVDNKIKKCDISCATCSSSPIKNEKNEVINCDTCNKDYGFYNIEGSTICINKTKIGEFYDEICKCYKKCHKDCLTCSGESLDQYHMNCLSCDISKGFQFYQKNSNCLNCKSLNKIVNYEQTECIDKVPEGYYINDTNLNTLDICHENCLKCSASPIKDGIIEQQNCLTCRPSLYLKNGNCIKTYTCPYKFFYQAKIDKNADLNQKICLEKEEACPCALPYLLESTNECVETCPLDLVFDQGCKISEPTHGLNNIMKLIELSYQQGLIKSLSKSFVLKDTNNLYEEILVKISLITQKILKLMRRRLQYLENYTAINITNDFESVDIDLGECESIIREYYDIASNVSLNIIKLEMKMKSSKITHILYEIYNPYNKSEKLDLSICQKEKIKFINKLDPSLSRFKLESIIESYPNDNNIFSENSNFYNDYCSKFISEEGADVLIQDRYLDYNYEGQLCQAGCQINDINTTSGFVVCLCPPKNEFGNISFYNFEQFYKKVIENNEKIISFINEEKYKNEKYSNNNFKALKCVKNIFSTEFSKNYVLIILTLLIFAYLLMVVIFFFYKKINKKETLSNPPSPNDKKEKNNKQKNKEKNHDNKTKKNEKKESKKQSITLKKVSKEKSEIISSKEYFSKPQNIYDNESKYSDKSFYKVFISLLKERLIILSCLSHKNIKRILNILLLISLLINYVGINTFFFSEKIIHQIYLDKNVYNFCYQFNHIIFSVIASHILIRLLKYLYSIKIIKKNNIKYILLFSISFAIFFFYWIYVGAITSLHINSKRHLFINILICLLFEIFLGIILTLIIASFRYMEVKFNNKPIKIMNRIIKHI